MAWWSGLAAAVQGGKPLHHDDVDWPGSADTTRARLDLFAVDWSRLLTHLAEVDLDRPVTFLAPEPRPLRIWLAWCNAELMKNVAEIGTVRHLYGLAKCPA